MPVDESKRNDPAWNDHRTFFLPPAAWRPPYELDAGETRHLTRVLRLGPGEEIRVLDGEGREGIFVVEACDRHRTRLRLVEEWRHPRPHSRVILAAGWTKAARRGWFLEKAVEFEAEGVWLWQAERSQFPTPEDIRTSWRDQLVAGAKQCRNPWLPELRIFSGGVEDLLAGVAALEAERGAIRKVVLLEEGLGAPLPLTPDRLAEPGTTLCVVGPEGGFTPREADRLQAGGLEPVTLGKRVLRWETAAMLCLGLYWWRRELADSKTPAAGPAFPRR